MSDAMEKLLRDHALDVEQGLPARCLCGEVFNHGLPSDYPDEWVLHVMALLASRPAGEPPLTLTELERSAYERAQYANEERHLPHRDMLTLLGALQRAYNPEAMSVPPATTGDMVSREAVLTLIDGAIIHAPEDWCRDDKCMICVGDTALRDIRADIAALHSAKEGT